MAEIVGPALRSSQSGRTSSTSARRPRLLTTSSRTHSVEIAARGDRIQCRIVQSITLQTRWLSAQESASHQQTSRQMQVIAQPSQTEILTLRQDIKQVKASEIPRPEPKTGLTSLPKELLIQIIGHALIKPHPITLHRPLDYRWAKELSSLQQKAKRHFKRTRKSPLLNVLLVNRDFYFAGLEAYYSGNTFHFGSPVDFWDTFVRTFSERHKACVKRVVIDWEWQVWQQRSTGEMKCFSRNLELPRELPSQDMLEEFTELQSATISVYTESEPVILAAASRADAAKAEIRSQVISMWPGRASKIEFTFPDSWGRLAAM